MLSLPTDSAQRAIVHLDGDAFFASLEQRDDPQLRGKPVAVGTGVVASCSYEARRDGVRTGMRLAEARGRCRDLIVVPGEYLRYEQAARQMLAICQERTPLVEAAALDDLYLDVTKAHGPVVSESSASTPRCPSLPGSSLTPLARELRTQIRDEISLSVSIGIGSNKLVAKVATKQAKPGREVCIAAGTEREYLAPWSVRVLPGAGRKIGDRLERLNVQRVHEAAIIRESKDQLRSARGRAGFLTGDAGLSGGAGCQLAALSAPDGTRRSSNDSLRRLSDCRRSDDVFLRHRLRS
jgi:DNA polymerase IV